MRTKRKIIRVLFVCSAVLMATSSWSAETVTIESLLAEMVDRESVARYPETDFRLKQHSSYNRASKTPDEHKGWFTNHDYNSSDKDHNFIRIEENNGRKEWVLMDHQAPGVMVRTWMPWLKQTEPGTDIEMSIYLDGAEEPVIVGNMLGLFDGTGLIPYPLAHPSLRSAVSFFPIPYAESCKVTVNKRPFFFQFTFREYPEGTPIKTFTLDDFETDKLLTKQVGETLLAPFSEPADDMKGFKTMLKPGEEKKVDLASGTYAVRDLMVKLGSFENPEVTRTVVLKMSFDGKETVWCPVGDFFGCGIGLNPVKGWYTDVADDGKMRSRWVMPYQKTASVSLVNFGDVPVEVELGAETGSWTWDERTMYFNAAWRGQYPVPTRPMSDWNYVTLQGKGVYVGDALTIMNPVEKWWGEGDERIWVDGEGFPSIFGTGTEDYYAYSWGGRSTDFYEHPFHAQPFSHKYNKLNRKTANEKNTMGFSTETRTRSLDTMPFGTSLQLDMEVWSGTDCDMGYQVGTMWYGFSDTTSNRKPETEEILNIPPLPKMNEPETAASMFNGAVEFEEMEMISGPKQLIRKPQNLKNYKGSWNETDHVLFKGVNVGDAVEFRIPGFGPPSEKLTLHATKSKDFGILSFSVNGKPAGSQIDLFAGKPMPSGAIELGVFEPIDDAYILRVEVVGKNPKSAGVLFGLDCVILK